MYLLFALEREVSIVKKIIAVFNSRLASNALSIDSIE